ncbi:hypothetical protein AVEN_214692-1 [Araneus ventricosus]|uniref:Uncharacterized protein n=1 Tax=Araneus ventricosus TaxID=182803 RepID=A0A4Y2NR72_ARAVE|nr:hypothetical protein AVEN_261479-1 [Araneus ventricosus]GBN41179.1 hypothetical protein AVEN_187570-1 [Araneus ventricosus]GBN73946.1 hypothetical protein AVEN_83259-1 [Araneus ventricosus]GBN73955.1 hypothetical protein AVEN_214692-1 [Araneus ventricosus]
MIQFRVLATDLLQNTNITIWDNSTETEIVKLVNYNKQAFFLIGMAFLGGLALGFLIHSIYVCIIKRVLIELGDDLSLSDGVVNLSFIGDDRPPANDHPPDYASVMSGDIPRENQGLFGFLKRIFKRRSSTDSENSIVEEEPPPSYSSVIEHLERDLNNR